MWRSDKIAKVQPKWARAEFANLLPLALSNGVFEANPKRIWSQVYSYNRPDIAVQDVETLLKAFQKVGLLFLWKNGESKVWGFWIGIDRPGRLPGKSRRGINEIVGPEPPEEELRKFMESNGIESLPGFGFGFGFGKGLGADSILESARPSPQILFEIWQENHGELPELRSFTSERKKKCRARLEDCGERFVDDFRKAIGIANKTPFCLGKNDREWKLDFDFLIANDTNVYKVLEGKYGSATGQSEPRTLTAKDTLPKDW